MSTMDTMNPSGTRADPIILGDDDSVRGPVRVPDRGPDEHQPPAKRGQFNFTTGTGGMVIHSAPTRRAFVVESEAKEGEAESDPTTEGEDEGEGEVPETQPVYCADQEEDPGSESGSESESGSGSESGSESESDPKVCIVDACDLEEGQTGKLIDPDTNETVTVTATFGIDPKGGCCDFCIKRGWP